MTQSKAIHADPTKDFFVTMITRDISVLDCIFDLIDNSIDAAPRSDGEANLTGSSIELTLSESEFRLHDNGAGMSLDVAINSAFHFGRKPESGGRGESIGLYGIGMKRAIFKLGRTATVTTETTDEAFEVSLNVKEWEQKEDWDFSYSDIELTGETGTTVLVTDLHADISQILVDRAFVLDLIKALSRDYSFFIDRGLSIVVNRRPVPSYNYTLKQDESVTPAVIEYEDEGVQVKIVAGLVDELFDEVPLDLRPDKVERSGWFVVCNDRVVLAADKTNRTVWDTPHLGRVWHGQYNGFAGFVFFTSPDPRQLPWTTTKRDVDTTNRIYRRALTRMAKLTGDFITYSNNRKSDPETALKAEASVPSFAIRKVEGSQTMKLPTIPKVTKTTVGISYSRPKEDVRRVAASLGTPGLSASVVGQETFDYYWRNEIAD